MPDVASSIQGDVHVAGNLSANSMSVPTGAVGDTQVAAGSAGGGIDYDKLRQLRTLYHNDTYATDASSKTESLGVARCAGTIVSAKAGSAVVAGAATNVTVTIKKNGASITSSAVTLDNSRAAYTLYSIGLSSSTFVAGDWFTVTYALTGTNEPTGILTELILDEDPV